MTGCSAPMCSNHSRNGFKFYRFPADFERRKIWLENCRRKNWTPTQNDRLCSAHFEDCQIEQNRADGKKRLLPFAVPTIFNISTRRKSFKKRLRYESKLNKFVTTKHSQSDVSSISSDELSLPLMIPEEPTILVPECLLEYKVKDTATELSELRNRIVNLEEELQLQNEAIARLEQELELKNKALAKFLTPGQIKKLQIKRKCIKK